MKKLLVVFCAMFLILFISWSAKAALTTIGTASYMGGDYDLIYEDDSIYGGLVWLDFTESSNTWQNQVDWAAGLCFTEMEINLIPGYTTTIDWSTGWRLPSAGDNPQAGYDQTISEIGHLYYDSLGKSAGGPLGDTSPFENLVGGEYWLGTEWSTNHDFAWQFLLSTGRQYPLDKDEYNNYALAVRPGQVSAIPIPGAVWFLGSGLIGIVGIRRKFKK